MAFALVFVGLVLIVTGANNTYGALGAQLKSDFTGSKSFVAWIVALGAVGALGYISDFRRFSHYFMALILISLVLSNKGFFANFTNAINSAPVAPQVNATGNVTPAQNTSQSPNGTDATGLFGQQPSSSGQAKFNIFMNRLVKGLFG